jgi:hypothetical protein
MRILVITLLAGGAIVLARPIGLLHLIGLPAAIALYALSFLVR